MLRAHLSSLLVATGSFLPLGIGLNIGLQKNDVSWSELKIPQIDIEGNGLPAGLEVLNWIVLALPFIAVAIYLKVIWNITYPIFEKAENQRIEQKAKHHE